MPGIIGGVFGVLKAWKFFKEISSDPNVNINVLVIDLFIEAVAMVFILGKIIKATSPLDTDFLMATRTLAAVLLGLLDQVLY